jgi:nucleotide-binding universal stress UspA family protein
MRRSCIKPEFCQGTLSLLHHEEVREMLPLRKILCPVDFSPSSLEALDVAKELSLHFGVELWLVHVVPEVPVAPISPRATSVDIELYAQHLEASCKDALNDIVSREVPKAVSVKPVVIKGEPGKNVVQLAKDHEMDLIVIADHGHGERRPFEEGPVAREILRHATVPVLTIHSSGGSLEKEGADYS